MICSIIKINPDVWRWIVICGKKYDGGVAGTWDQALVKATEVAEGMRAA